MLDRLGIYERVGGDDGPDREHEPDVAKGLDAFPSGMPRGSAQPNEKDPGGDGEDSDGGAGRDALTQSNRAEDEHHDWSRPASDRIDDRDLTPVVGAREQDEIGQLQSGRSGDKRDRVRRNAAGEQSRHG